MRGCLDSSGGACIHCRHKEKWLRRAERGCSVVRPGEETKEPTCFHFSGGLLEHLDLGNKR